MTWQPGQPVVTAQDRAEWQQWRRDRKREQQRERRATNRRIDYYPDKLAAEVIDANGGPWGCGDYSSTINQIVAEWAQCCHRNKLRADNGAEGGAANGTVTLKCR